MSTLELFSARVCPFAHRTRLVLGEKGVPFTHTEIDLARKPVWFGEVSLYGKVPALRHGAFTLAESAVINEYLEEVFPRRALLPAEATARARARFWIDFANTRLAPAFGKLLRGDGRDEQEEGRRELDASLALIETEALGRLSGDGPYWFGAEVSLVDLTFYPWFERLPALAHHRGYALPAHPRLRRWIAAVADRPATRAIANETAFYIERYARFVRPAVVAAQAVAR